MPARLRCAPSDLHVFLVASAETAPSDPMSSFASAEHAPSDLHVFSVAGADHTPRVTRMLPVASASHSMFSV